MPEDKDEQIKKDLDYSEGLYERELSDQLLLKRTGSVHETSSTMKDKAGGAFKRMPTKLELAYMAGFMECHKTDFNLISKTPKQHAASMARKYTIGEADNDQ
jgi:hypothetical protein